MAATPRRAPRGGPVRFQFLLDADDLEYAGLLDVCIPVPPPGPCPRPLPLAEQTESAVGLADRPPVDPHGVARVRDDTRPNNRHWAPLASSPRLPTHDQ